MHEDRLDEQLETAGAGGLFEIQIFLFDVPCFVVNVITDQDQIDRFQDNAHHFSEIQR